MLEANEAVVIFRTADADRNTQADLLAERLRAAGIDAAVAGEEDPGVVVGTCEVRVAAADRGRAEEVMAALPAHLDGDLSADLDMVAIFTADGVSAEMEALAIKGILDSAGIEATVMAAPQIPSLPVEVHVARADAAAAMEAIEAARAAGPAAAEEGAAETPASPEPATTEETETESGVDPSPELDMVPIFSADGISAEMEALAVKGILESSGIKAVMVGTAALPFLPFEVQVPREDADTARQAIAAAQAAGPSDADAGFQASGS